MLWWMFFPLFAVALVMLVASFHYEIYPMFAIPGLLFLILAGGLFATGITVQTGELEYTDWENQTITEYQYSTTEGGPNILTGMMMLGFAFFSWGGMLIYATKKEDREYRRTID